MSISVLPFYDKLQKKIMAYYQTIWKEKWRENILDEWLNNFQNSDIDVQEKEKCNMLYLLSKFMYFGHNELRQLLSSLYRDLFKYPIIEAIRMAHGDTTDSVKIEEMFLSELQKTRFLGVGNPSESGVHMLYYLRQECGLSKEYFINASEIFSLHKITEKGLGGTGRTCLESLLRNNDIRRYVFIDDFCGSGSQASKYLKNTVESIKVADKDIEVNYLMLFGTEQGIEVIRKLGIFNNVKSVFSIDDSFIVFSDASRYFVYPPDAIIDKGFSKETVIKYGEALSCQALGYNQCQLLFSLFHNTPDNTLPIFWSEGNNWVPIFKRFNKIY